MNKLRRIRMMLNSKSLSPSLGKKVLLRLTTSITKNCQKKNSTFKIQFPSILR